MNPNPHPTEQYLNLSRVELLVRMGNASSLADSLDLEAPSVRESILAAKTWFSDNYDNLKTKLCGKQATISSHIASKRTLAVAAVCDLLTQTYGVTPIVFVSLYLFDYGLERFCSETKTDFLKAIDNEIKH